ncbi:phosphopentomutase [bacterium]|nr:phosphopentomutase [bacterium]MDY4582656.1 phosphopentomutase [Candidatus Faecousia sp.]
MKRIFLIVLDSFGIGAMPDSESFGDVGVNTLGSCATSDKLHIPNMIAAGLGCIDGVDCLPKPAAPTGAVARLTEASMGKDTTIGHWEIAGVVSPNPLPTYPQGFPKEVLDAFEAATGRGWLCNLPYSGTDVIRDYGQEQLDTGKWILYTSADSVFQVAAHEEKIPLQELYDACRKARGILRGKHGVGRVIARPFVGDPMNGFRRTSNRHDFSLEPPAPTMLDAIKAAGLDSIAVGKINDIFAGQGTTEHVFNKSNADGMDHAMDYAGKDFHGLCFVNLVDFDMLYGHRRDIDGYAKALSEFDAWLGEFLPRLGEEDLVMITADHGCDPAYTATTDHTREYVPLLVLGKAVKPGSLGTRGSYADIAATVTELLGVEYETPGRSFAKEMIWSIPNENIHD